MLRLYQNKIVVDSRAHMLNLFKRILIESPTGSGKTHLSAYMMEGSFKRNWSAWFMVHREELMNQTAKTFRSYNIPFGINGSDGHLLQLWSVGSLSNRYKDLQPPDAMYWDECHHIGARTWDEIFQWAAGAFHIGLSATPILPNGQPLGKWFDKMVNGPTVPELIALGNLSDFDYFAPHTPDLSQVRGVAEFNTDDVEKIMQGKAVVGSIIQTWQREAAGKLTIGFAPTVATSKMYVDSAQAAGIRAAHLDGDTPKGERRDTALAFAHREIDMLWNVDLFGEGFDLAALADTDVAIECVIMARPTKSLRLCKQQVGRGLRPKPDGSKGIILDHCGNWTRHGMPDDVIEWKLDAKPVRKSNGGTSVAVTQCPSCYMVFRPAPVCPHCGQERPVNERPLVYMPGELKIIERDQRAAEKLAREQAREKEKAERAAEKARQEKLKKQKLKERREARTYKELIAFAERWGYENPTAWAARFNRMRHEYRRK